MRALRVRKDKTGHLGIIGTIHGETIERYLILMLGYFYTTLINEVMIFTLCLSKAHIHYSSQCEYLR